MLFDEFPFNGFIVVYFIISIYSDCRFVCRSFQNRKFVDLFEFLSFRQSRTCHTCKLSVLFEKILISDCCKRFGFSLDLYSFFGFYRLMQAFGKSSSWHRTTGMFVDDEHFIIFHDIFLIFFIDCLCTKRVFDMMDLFVSNVFVKIFYFENLFQFSDTSSAQCRSFGFFIDIIITVFFLIFS